MADSAFIRHVPCSECGSSDAGALYEDGSCKCHKCGHRWIEVRSELQSVPPSGTSCSSGLIQDVTIGALPERRITEETCRKWGYGYSPALDAHVATYCDATGRPVAQKLRTREKKFWWVGDRSRVGLYGEWLWRDGGRMIVLTEGEIDALSVSQAQNNRYPAASITGGAGSAATEVTKSLRWLEKFDRVILMFDMDDPGRDAAEACARLLSPGKAYIANLPAKDPNDLLRAGRSRDIISAAWDAKPWAPGGIVTGADLVGILSEGLEPPVVRWPWPELDRRTLGIRRGNIVLLAAGIGAGKTTLCRTLVSEFLDQGVKVGVIPLEENIRQFGVGLLGVRAGQNMVIAEATKLPPALMKVAEEIKDRIVFMDDTGDRRDDAVLDAIRYMALGCKCDIVLIDHLTMVLGRAQEGNERRHAERLILEIEAMTKRTGVIALIVVHLRKPGEGRSHEEGRRVSMSDIRGTGLIAASAHQVIAYERDQQDETERFGVLRVLKGRPVGRTGKADTLEFDEKTGRLHVVVEGVPPIPEDGITAIQPVGVGTQF